MDSEHYTHYQNIASEIAMPEDGILSKTLLNNDRMRVTIFAMSAGQEMTEHTASKDAIVHILDGEIAFTVSGVNHTLTSGSWLHMVPGTPHSLTATVASKFYLVVLR